MSTIQDATLNGIHLHFFDCPSCFGVGKSKGTMADCRTCRGFGRIRATSLRGRGLRNGWIGGARTP